MLSKYVTSLALRQNAARSLRMTPYIFNRAMVSIPQRHFLDRLGLQNSTELVIDPKGGANQGQVSLW
jgi:hypothetical protein